MGDGADERFMFHRGEAGLQRCRIIIGQNGDACLGDDLSGVHAVIDVMHGAATFVFAGGNDGFVHVQAVHAHTAVCR